jgi:hypothetical protein
LTRKPVKSSKTPARRVNRVKIAARAATAVRVVIGVAVTANPAVAAVRAAMTVAIARGVSAQMMATSTPATAPPFWVGMIDRAKRLP